LGFRQRSQSSGKPISATFLMTVPINGMLREVRPEVSPALGSASDPFACQTLKLI
jgi:hypothetical protein